MGIRRRIAIIYQDKTPDELLDLVQRAHDAKIDFELRADIQFGRATSFWANNEAIFIFEDDHTRAAFMLLE